MARNPIQELQGRVKAGLELYAGIQLNKINSMFESLGVHPSNRINFGDEITHNGRQCIRFYDVTNHGKELPVTIFLEQAFLRSIYNRNTAQYGDILLYLEDAYQATMKIGGVHECLYGYGYQGGIDSKDIGFGINLPISELTARKLNVLSVKEISGLRLDVIESYLKGEEPIKLPAKLIVDALVVRKSHAEYGGDMWQKLKIKYPREFDLPKIYDLLNEAREKHTAEEQSVRVGLGE